MDVFEDYKEGNCECGLKTTKQTNKKARIGNGI